jgi:hypothetical protein
MPITPNLMPVVETTAVRSPGLKSVASGETENRFFAGATLAFVNSWQTAFQNSGVGKERE